MAQWIRVHLSMQGTRFNSWSWKIPCAVEPLSPGAASTELHTRGLRTLQQEKPPKSEACAPRLQGSPHSPQREKALGQQ